MLLMVIEHIPLENMADLEQRFRESGRMLPAEVTYHSSWLDDTGETCFQLMEAPSVDSLSPWMAYWGDLVEFDVIPVQTSADFWAKRARPT